MADISILDQHGKPMAMSSAYQAGNRFNRELATWNPLLRSADAEILPERDTTVARMRDLTRNYGMASGAVNLHLDNVIGAGLRLVAKPDYKMLGQTAEWAQEWSRTIEPRFRTWAYDIDKMSDAGERLTLAGRLWQGYSSYLINGEILAVAEWIPGRGYWNTAIQMVSIDRLSNPENRPDTATLRGGIELNKYGAPVAYWIRERHPHDVPGFLRYSDEWKRVPARTPWGRRQVIHIYDQEMAGQTRGISKAVASIITNKKLDRYEQVRLESAIVQSMYAAVIESELSTALDALGGGDMSEQTTAYIQSVLDYHSGADIRFDGIKIPHLFPGEKLNLNRPSDQSDFAPFEDAFLRHLAAGWNLPVDMLSRDNSKTNYSGARSGQMQAWKHFSARRETIAAEYARQEYALWLEEDYYKGDWELPRGAPDFRLAKTAWTGSRWIGPGKGQIDPLKEENAASVAISANRKTLEQYCAEQGEDYEEVLMQRAREKRLIDELGLQDADLSSQIQDTQQEDTAQADSSE